MGVEKKIFCLRLDEEIIETLRRLAAKENRTPSNYVETIIKKHILSADNKK